MSSKNHRLARLQTRPTGETRDGLPVHELLSDKNGHALAEAVSAAVPTVALSAQEQAKFDELCRQLLAVQAAVQQTQAHLAELSGQDRELRGRIRERVLMLCEARDLDANGVNGTWNGERFVLTQALPPPAS